MRKRRFEAAAIVLGTEVNGIAVIRSLGRLGVRCGAICAPSPGDHAVNSRYLACLKIVRRDDGDEALVSAIRIVADRMGGGRAVLIPTTDRYSEFLSRNQAALSKDFMSCCPDTELSDAFLDKWNTAQLCIDNGILIPSTACPETADHLAKVAGEMTFPVIVKPRYTFGTGFPGKNAVFDEPRALLDFFDGSNLLGHCVVQQIIPSGDGDIIVTASYSAENGIVQAMYSGRKIRQHLPDYGATCFGISERHPDLEVQSRRFLESIGYKGFAALEFARSRDGWAGIFSRAEHANLLPQPAVCRCWC